MKGNCIALIQESKSAGKASPILKMPLERVACFASAAEEQDPGLPVSSDASQV